MPAESPVKSREVRLGLVMYGGVSLAIYINGVADQLHRAVRGRGIYRLIKLLTGSEILVDVLSGSSAGGINGILLASALCNGKEFAGTANLWRENGDISALLRDPNADLMDCNSLLDSEGYYQSKLEEAFSSLAHAELDAGEREDPSPVSELDLFVTGTDFHGRESYRYDDAGHLIYVKDHRTVFQLKHRAERKEPFHPQADGAGWPEKELAAAAAAEREKRNVAALAKLARITSCFPAAFAPVQVTPPPEDGREANTENAVDARLSLWGRISSPSTFIDGGVLDNKPFSTTLDAIFHRMADRPVRRFLLYVEPDPERAPLPAKEGESKVGPDAPNIVRTALDSLTSIPSYESIAADLKAISKHNDRIERLRCLSALEFAPAPGRSSSEAPSAPSAPDSTGSEEVYWRARWAAFSESIIQLIADDGSLTEEMAQRLERLCRWKDWIELYPDAKGGSTAAERRRAQQELERYDVGYQLRRAISVTYMCEEKGLESPSSECLSIFNREVQLLEIARYHFERRVAGIARPMLVEPGATPRLLWDSIRAGLDKSWNRVSLPESCSAVAQLDLGNEAARNATLSQDELKVFHRAFEATDVPASESNGLLERTQSFEAALLQQAPPVRERYQRFAARDTIVFPLEVASGLAEKDTIRTVRMSPVDARRGLSNREDKVCGARLAHFSAFFKRAWRSNDILWGRLDAACQLVETLVDAERVGEVLQQGTLGAELESWCRELGDGTVLESCPDGLRKEIADWLKQLAAPSQRAEALKRLDPKASPEQSMFERLVLAEQLEILHRDLPCVVADAVQEQFTWNQFRSALPLPEASAAGGPPVVRVDGQGLFVAGEHAFSVINVELASRQLARAAISQLAEAPKGGGAPPAAEQLGPLGNYFRSGYQMGRERIEQDIPRIVLLELLGRSVLVARNSLLNAFGPYADTIRGNLFYWLLLDYPLRLFAAITAQLRRSPTAEQDVVFASIAYTAVSVIVLVLFGSHVLWTGDGPSVAGFVLFIVAPLVMMAVVAALSTRYQQQRALRVARGLLTFVGLALAVSGTVLLIGLFFPGSLTPEVSLTLPWLPKAAAVAMPLVGGIFLQRRLSGRRLFEEELRDRLAGFNVKQLDALGQQLFESRWPPNAPAMLLQGGRRRALVRRARRAGKLDALQQMLRRTRPAAG